MATLGTVLVHVQLLDEGTPTARGTQAIPMGNGEYKLLPTENYNPGDEIWEFLPGSVVKCETVKDANSKKILLAVEKVG